MRRISKSIMLKRLAKLRDGMTTSEVAKTLGLSTRTLAYWLKDPVFKQNEIATQRQWGHHWHRQKLIAWVQAVMKMSETKNYNYKPKRANNPPVKSVEMNPRRIAEVIDLPEGFKVSR